MSNVKIRIRDYSVHITKDIPNFQEFLPEFQWVEPFSAIGIDQQNRARKVGLGTFTNQQN